MVDSEHLHSNAARAALTALGVSAAAVGLVSGAASLGVAWMARPRAVWGHDEPPATLAEDVIFPSEDGTPLSGWFLRADARRPAPTVIICHGFSTGRREGLPWALRLVGAGFNVLCFDFRAHGVSGGRFMSIGLHETGDVIGAIAFVTSRSDVDVNRI